MDLEVGNLTKGASTETAATPPALMHLHVSGGEVELEIRPAITEWHCTINGQQVPWSEWEGGTLRLNGLQPGDRAVLVGPSLADLVVEGAASVFGDIRQKNRLRISAAGGCSISLKGRVGYLVATQRGAGELCCEMLRASWAWLSLASEGVLQASVLKQVRIDRSGAGRLTLNRRLTKDHPDRQAILEAGWEP